jgi:hypothetical protein
MCRKSALPVPVFVLLALTASLQALSAQSYDDLAGGWIVQSRTAADGTVNENPQRGLYLFTATGQYSMMFVNTAEPRPDLTEDATDAQLLEAWESITANSGRYRLSGNQLTYEAWVAKWPTYMNAWDTSTGGNAITVTMSMEDGRLTLAWEDGRKVVRRRGPGLAGGGGG